MELVVPVEGGEVWAQDTGGDGTPLVLMHPGWGDSAIWDPMLGRLAARYRVIRYDNRGHGRSPGPAAADMGRGRGGPGRAGPDPRRGRSVLPAGRR